MAIQKRFIHFKKFSDFNSKKLSANEANTQYTIGVSGEVQTGAPDILYQSYCWIKDTKQQWTHGQLYDCSGGSGDVNLSEYLTAEEIAEIYATIESLDGKQDTLVSGTNIKSINGNSILGSGNINMPYYERTGHTYVQKGISDDDLIYALPTSAGGDEDDVIATRDTLKTINGESLMGNGDITISGGGGSSAYSEVSHGTSDTTFALTPNTFHIWDEVSSLTLTLGAETSGVANEYLFQFTSGSTATTLSLPDDIKWTGGDAPTIEANKIYQVSILKGLGSVLEWDNTPALIENKATKSGLTVTFQYPVASDLTITQLSGNTTVITAGNTTVTLSQQASISSITPSSDNTYKYTW